MAELRFWRVLLSNIQCAFCSHKKCPVRYYPERKRNHYYDGVRYTEKCQKDLEKDWKKDNWHFQI